MKSSLTIPIAIVVGGVIVALAVYASAPKTPRMSAGNPALVRPVGINDHILGNPAAPVMIVEYSDFDCTYCKSFHDTLHQIIANDGVSGKVAWVFRHFPLSEVHPNTLSHALASECVAATAGNDAFWRFADALFKNQSVDPSRYGELASSVGISGNEFATCFSDIPADITARVARDRQNALDIGTDGTPYSIILTNGKPPVVMNGAYSYDAVKQLVDEALGNSN